MGRRRASRRESDASDASKQEEEDRGSDEDESGSSEDGSVSGDSDSDGSGVEGSGEDEEEQDKDGDADKRARVARDVEQMQAMCAEMDKMKRRLQFRLDAAREARLDALWRETEAREKVERRQAAAADIDAPQVPAPTTNGLPAGEISPPPPVPVLLTDAGVQTDYDMKTMDRMEASLRASSNSAEITAPVSLPTSSNSVRLESAVSDSAHVLPASVDDRSPGLSINDLDKSGGAADGRTRNAVSAFYDQVLTGFSRSKKMDTIPSVSSDSDRSATPDQPSWPSSSHHSVEERVVSDATLRTANSSFGNRPPTAEGASHYSHQAKSVRGSYQAADDPSARSSGVMFDAQDSLRVLLSPESTASADKTDEQRELEAIQSLLFGR